MNLTPLAEFLRGAQAGRSQAAQRATSRYADPGQKIGIEFEIEDWNGGGFTDHWDTHSDASLRNGIEFVFTRGKMGTEVENALDLFARTARNTSFSISERTSTHIHMDMGDGQRVIDVRKMFVLTYMIEPAMFRMADENRKWCSYCQPLTDMQQGRINSILTATNASALVEAFQGSRHQDKYYAFNLASLNRHCTIEFRYFPGYSDMESVDKWINLVQEVKLAAASVDTMEELLSIGMDSERMASFLRERMPRSVASGLLGMLDSHDSTKRASYLNAILATSDIPTASLHQRLQQVQPGSAAARMLTALFGMRFDANSQRTAVLRSVLNGRTLNPEDLNALRTIVGQMDSGAEFETLIADFINGNNN